MAGVDPGVLLGECTSKEWRHWPVRGGMRTPCTLPLDPPLYGLRPLMTALPAFCFYKHLASTVYMYFAKVEASSPCFIFLVLSCYFAGEKSQHSFKNPCAKWLQFCVWWTNITNFQSAFQPSRTWPQLLPSCNWHWIVCHYWVSC